MENNVFNQDGNYFVELVEGAYNKGISPYETAIKSIGEKAKKAKEVGQRDGSLVPFLHKTDFEREQ